MKNHYDKLASIMPAIYCRALSAIRSERGQTLVEYSLLLVLIAVVVVLMVKGVGLTANNTYSRVNSAVSAAVN